MYIWYNNGKRNKKIYDDIIPEGFIKGYIVKKNKMDRLKKITKRYQNKITKMKAKYMEIIRIKEEKLEAELKIAQNAIFPDLS